MDEHAPTPPVVDPDALAYEGIDRRRVDPLTQAIANAVGRNSPPARQADPRDVIGVVKDAVVVALVVLVLISQFRLADRINENNDQQQEFRDGVSCFLVESVRGAAAPAVTPAAQQKAATDILIRCGFVQSPGRP